MKHAKRSGWRPFWAALCAALLMLLPLVGGTVLLSRAQLRSSLRQAAKSQSGVPIRLPKAADRCTVLLCVADETPGFVLAYLNAGQNCIHLLAVPAALEVPFGGKNVPLADCYAAAGPARCREALGEVFALPEDTDYLAVAPAVLTKLAARYGAVRVGFTGALTPEQRGLVDTNVKGGSDHAADKAHGHRQQQPFTKGADIQGRQTDQGLRPLHVSVFHDLPPYAMAGTAWPSSRVSSSSGFFRYRSKAAKKREYSMPVAMRSSITTPRGIRFLRLPAGALGSGTGLPMQTNTLVVPNS